MIISKTVTSAVTCKNCGGTVMVEKQNVTETTNQSGGISTKMCPKCNKTSSYTFEMHNGQFTNFR